MAAVECPQLVSPDEMYLVAEVQRRLRMGTWAWRKFREKSGLKPIKIGLQCYVAGRAVIEAIERMAEVASDD